MNATIALAIRYQERGEPELVETISDLREITVLEAAIASREPNPLDRVFEHRSRLAREDEEFSNYVEELLSRPFLKSEVQEHGVQWLKSRIRIEHFHKNEIKAAKIIAEFAFEVFRSEPDRTDFLLSGPQADVRVRVFILEDSGHSLSLPSAG